GVNGENNMTGALVFGPKDIWICNGNLYHYDGIGWNFVSTSWNGALSGASLFGFSSKDFWITYHTVVLHYTGGGNLDEYRVNRLIPGGASPLYSGWGTSSKDMYFVGDYGTIIHFDGIGWSKFPAVTSKNLYSLSGRNDHDIW